MTGGVQANGLRLGRLVGHYKKSSAHAVKVVIVSLVSVGIAAFFFAGAFSRDMSNNLAGRIVLMIPGLLFLLPVLAAIYTLFRGRGATLSLYENGLTYRRGGKESATTWDEIDSYIQETACRITRKDGEIIEFGFNLENANELAQKIQDETLRRMLPQIKAAVLKGSSVQFKGLKPAEKIPLGQALDNFMLASSGFTVDAHGITQNDGGNRIAWEAVTDFGVVEEKLGRSRPQQTIEVFFIQDANNSLRTRFGLLSNAHVLLALCGEMVGQSRERDGHN